MTDFVRDTLRRAGTRMRSGDLAAAEALLREVLGHDPGQPESLHALARIALQQGRTADSVPLLREALGRAPQAPLLHADLAVALQELGRNEEAADAAGRALALEPSSVSALNTLGNALRSLGRAGEAAERFRAAIALRPAAAVLHLNLAGALRDAGRAAEGLEACRRAVELEPGNAEGHYRLGTLLRSLGHPVEAAQSLIRAIELDPAYAEAHNALGNAFVELGERDAAEQSYRRALAAQPDLIEGLYNLGDLLRGSGRVEEAHGMFARAAEANPEFADARVRLAQCASELGRHEAALAGFAGVLERHPDHAEALVGLGNAARALGDVERATEAYRAAVAKRPDLAEGWCNLSTACLDRGARAEAEDAARRAIAVAPALPEAHWNLGQALLTAGDYRLGWPKYEYRLLKSNAAELAFPFPSWDGATLAGRTLFVTAEQGVGDEIMFASCLPEAIDAAARVIVECDARLVPLFARSFPRARAIARLADPGGYPAELPPPDCRVAIGSLPLRFRTDPDRFPSRRAYLVPDPAEVARWRARYAALGPGLKVGLSWRGGKDALVRRARSIPLERWGALAAVAGVTWVNLQYGDCAAELDAARRGPGLRVHDWADADPLKDLDGLAARIAALDLVISVDNATVHMAGAVGTPTWVLLPVAADWRWMESREDSPWYPALRLCRRRDGEEWEAVMERAARSLAARVERGEAPETLPPGHGVAVATPAPAPARSRRSAVLLNDTTYWYHWGCTGTSTAIAEMLERRGYAVGRVPITALQHCTGGPDSPEAFDDPAVFERFAAANPWLIRELAPAEVVVMNGEGSLHGFNPFVSNLLYVAFVASVRLGKRVQILNHSCYPDESAEACDSPAWRIYRKVYGALERAVIREPRSFALLERAGFRVERGGDCLPLWIRDHFEPERWPRRGGVVVAGSVAAAGATAEAYGALIAGLARRGVPVRALIGANMFPAAEEEEFLAAVAARAAGALDVVRAASLDEWLGVVAGADLVVSGRFHHTMAAAALGTPYVLLGSNTPKNAGLAEMLRTPAPFAPGGDGLAGSLAAAVEAALGSRPAPAARDTLARELCELATRNFDGLPALAG